MRAFGVSGYLLRNARVEVRLVYTGFLLLLAVGLGTTAALQWAHVGPRPADVATHFRGGERADGSMAFAKTTRELVELTHFHAFVMSAVYLILAHLLLATAAPDAVKRGAIVLGFLGHAGDLAGPWLITFVSGGFAWWQLASWMAQWTAYAAFVACPLAEMWIADGAPGRTAR